MRRRTLRKTRPLGSFRWPFLYPKLETRKPVRPWCAHGVQDAYTELAASDATLWGGYISGVRIDGARAYITLQVAADDPQRDDLGTRAAKAMSTLLPGTAVEDINWLIVEDANGTVIAQEQPNPIM